jgi:hypothetical protein
MQIADVIIFIAEDSVATRSYLKNEFKNEKFISEIKVACNITCEVTVEPYPCVRGFEEIVKERSKKTGEDNQLYLSVGILDLANLNYNIDVSVSESILDIPVIALAVLEQELVPVFGVDRPCSFRAVFLTNVINYCNTEINDPKTAESTRVELTSMRDKITNTIQSQLSSRIVSKKEKKRRGEGWVDTEVIENAKKALIDIIKEEIQS